MNIELYNSKILITKKKLKSRMQTSNNSFRKRFYFKCPLGPGAIGMDRFITYWKTKWSPFHTYELIRWEPKVKGGCIMIELSGMTIFHFENTVLEEPVKQDFLEKEVTFTRTRKEIPLVLLLSSEEIKQEKTYYAVCITFRRTKFLTLESPSKTNWKLKKIREDASAYRFHNNICCVHLSRVSDVFDMSDVTAFLYFPNELYAQTAAFEILENQKLSQDSYNFKYVSVIERKLRTN